MAEYLTYTYLRTSRSTLTHHFDLNESRASYASTIKVFLSHKHSEGEELINSVKGFFRKYGADIYIDWQEDSMPSITNAETARQLKRAISNSKKFVVLATPESIKSVWIPWEMGLADQVKGLENMALLPIAKMLLFLLERGYLEVAAWWIGRICLEVLRLN